MGNDGEIGASCPLDKIVLGVAVDGSSGTSDIIGANDPTPPYAVDTEKWSEYIDIINNQKDNGDGRLAQWYQTGGVMVWVYNVENKDENADTTRSNVMSFFKALADNH